MISFARFIFLRDIKKLCGVADLERTNSHDLLQGCFRHLAGSFPVHIASLRKEDW